MRALLSILALAALCLSTVPALSQRSTDWITGLPRDAHPRPGLARRQEGRGLLRSRCRGLGTRPGPELPLRHGRARSRYRRRILSPIRHRLGDAARRPRLPVRGHAAEHRPQRALSRAAAGCLEAAPRLASQCAHRRPWHEQLDPSPAAGQRPRCAAGLYPQDARPDREGDGRAPARLVEPQRLSQCRYLHRHGRRRHHLLRSTAWIPTSCRALDQVGTAGSDSLSHDHGGHGRNISCAPRSRAIWSGSGSTMSTNWRGRPRPIPAARPPSSPSASIPS